MTPEISEMSEIMLRLVADLVGRHTPLQYAHTVRAITRAGIPDGACDTEKDLRIEVFSFFTVSISLPREWIASWRNCEVPNKYVSRPIAWTRYQGK